ncbi:MAG: class II D-tagatose-bisphosphate aldolase, non-catalytic subunit [Synergistaceae bacterium]|nr:class II D-tagatose-bisphosphate aldolase, non-catalytic subunit [Synergistaceae bacterium]
MDTWAFFSDLLNDRRRGKPSGIYSVCCANPIVLEAAMNHAASEGTPILIEATSNQVNQYGGYTGMKPADFAALARNIADRSGFDPDNLILGGDHLGPLVWRGHSEAEAMPEAEKLIASYAEAGFTKIHIDTSMKLGDDPLDLPLDDDVIASRGARLCAVAESAGKTSKPVYVIGSEVPTPGGAAEKIDALTPTSPEAFKASRAAFEREFGRLGLNGALERVVAFVVQPGVDFNGDRIFDYDRSSASALAASLRDAPRPLVFEGHSTDYQNIESLSAMVEDGIGILKVGPALTFALREGLVALEQIEHELIPGSGLRPSDFSGTLETVMASDDSHWKNHYHGDGESLRLQRRYSFFDRARYYLPTPEVDRSVKQLLLNLEQMEITLPLLSQYLPRSFDRVRRGVLSISPRELLKDCVRNALSPYSLVCAMPRNKK